MGSIPRFGQPKSEASVSVRRPTNTNSGNFSARDPVLCGGKSPRSFLFVFLFSNMHIVPHMFFVPLFSAVSPCRAAKDPHILLVPDSSLPSLKCEVEADAPHWPQKMFAAHGAQPFCACG